MKDVNYPLSFIWVECQRRRWAFFNRIDWPGFSALMPVKGRPWNRKRLTGSFFADMVT
jgi:hypothetical protein